MTEQEKNNNEDLTSIENQEWLESLEYVLKEKGPERVNETPFHSGGICPQLWSRITFYSQYALYKFNSKRKTSILSRVQRNRTKDKKYYPMECDGYGGPG